MAGSSSNQNWKKLIGAYKKAKIATPDLKLITLAQWALESGWGKSELAKKYHNFSGLKYRARMAGFADPIDYEASDGIDTYCSFDSLDKFIEGYWHFIASGPYEGWQGFSSDPIGYVQHIHAKGFAGDSNYVGKITSIYYDLQEEGILNGSAEIDRPPRSAFGDTLEPVFEPVAGVSHRSRGQYPNGVEGLIVHYDAFRIRKKGSKEENSDARTIQMIKSGAGNGYRYAEISRTGRVFVPENWDFENWGYHAGKSECPDTNRTSVSQYYVGIEMNNPGLLYQSQTDGEFCPWYNSNLNSSGRVILDSRGRCYRRSAQDETYTNDEVRYASGDNITKGYYLPYSRDQFDMLVAVIRYLEAEFPKSFRLDYVFGHDEVSPLRKQDPGGALAHEGRLMTMPEFRAGLANGLF